MPSIRLFFIGDIVGKPGRAVLKNRLRAFVEEQKIEFVVANAENAAGGSGLTAQVARELFETGIEVLTMGDHVWRQLEIVPMMESDDRIIRPINYPSGTPGRGFTIREGPKGSKIAVINALGRVYMKPIDCPFMAVEKALEEIYRSTRVILVDFHAEATSEKIAMGWFLDGRVSAVLGTHTHVLTADWTVLPKGTAYITDAGMTGPYDSVIGRRKDRVIMSLTTLMPFRFDVAAGDSRISGAILEVDPETGRASFIEAAVINEDGRRIFPKSQEKGSTGEK